MAWADGRGISSDRAVMSSMRVSKLAHLQAGTVSIMPTRAAAVRGAAWARSAACTPAAPLAAPVVIAP